MCGKGVGDNDIKSAQVAANGCTGAQMMQQCEGQPAGSCYSKRCTKNPRNVAVRSCMMYESETWPIKKGFQS